MKRILGLLALAASAALAQTPAVTQITNNYGLINSGTLAQGAIFFVKGSNLADQETTTLQNVPLQTNLKNVQIRITVGATQTFAPLYYAFNGQLAGILPSNTPVGNGTLVVINNGRTSAPAPLNVVKSAFGMLTLNGAGTGAAAVHNDAYVLLAANNATNPGKAVIFYGSGLGPTPAADETVAQTGVNASGDLTSIPITVSIGGKSAQVLYHGRTIYPGLDQINVVIPTLDAGSYGCDVAVIITTNNVQANAGTIPVAQTGTTCPPPTNGGGGGGNSSGLTQSQIDAIVARGVYKSGGMSLSRTTTYTTSLGTTTTTRNDTASATFTSTSGPDLPKLFGTSTLPAGFQIPAPGVCNVFDTLNIPNVASNVTVQYLNAGASLNVRGPAGSRAVPQRVESTGIFYNAEVGNGTPGNFQDPGSYTFTGPGGPDVGSFSLTVDVAPEILWTNRTSLGTITRANGVTVTWTGGEPTQLVFISGTSFDVTSGTAVGASFQCYANQSAGSFTVPASILNRLPASTEIGEPPFSFSFPGTLAISSVGKVAWGSASGVDILSFSSQSTTAQSTTYR